MTQRAPTIYLDRDGTLVEDVGYLSRLEDLRLLPGVGEALARLQAAGHPLVVVTNQSGVARGYFDKPFVAASAVRLGELLAPFGVTLTGHYHCPHHPAGTVAAYAVRCPCRKPAPGMLLRAAREQGLALEGAVMVGDKRSDLDCGRGLGLRPVLVRTGEGRATERDLPTDFAARGGVVVDGVGGLPVALGLD